VRDPCVAFWWKTKNGGGIHEAKEGFLALRMAKLD
jgi:hypothetical protein